jgi:hypothetical protein
VSHRRTFKKILRLRLLFAELIPGRTPGQVYTIIAQKEDEDENTVAAQINCNGNYRKFYNEVISAEKNTPKI